ncbi:LCP family protein [Chloroflexi bacterium TSY]|nr:LCP family protein [Chloroflexi bacterium TSY]
MNRPRVPITSLSLSSQSAQPSISWSQTENFLILGTDRRPDWVDWRTDVIMIVGLDRANRRASVLSVPRDLYVEIPSNGWGRINRVDYLGERVLKVEGGGPALVSIVLSKTLGISTDHWIRVEMSGFEALVDAIGGVTVHLDCPFFSPIFNLDTQKWDYFTLPAGDVLMDGETARWFVRLRLRESDIGRSRRQRQFLWALRDQALSTNLLTCFPQLWSALSGLFTTDLTLWQMADLARIGLSFDANDVRAAGLTLRDLESYRTESGAAVLRITNPDAIHTLVEGVWQAAPMSATNRRDETECPQPPNASPAATSGNDIRAANQQQDIADIRDEETENENAVGRDLAIEEND